MTTRFSKLVLTLTIGLMAMGSFANVASADEELETLRQTEALKKATASVETRENDIESFGLADKALERCGAAPEITVRSITNTTSRTGPRRTVLSPYQRWMDCTAPLVNDKKKIKAAEDSLKPAVEEVNKLGIERRVSQECGPVPTAPQDQNAVEVEKFEIKTRLWVECSPKAIKTARADINKQALFDDVAYIQGKAKEFNLGGKLSDVCSATTKFLNLSKDQLAAYGEILEIKNWHDCARKNIHNMVSEGEYEKRLEAQALEKAQQTLNEANRLLEAQRQKQVKPTPAPASKPKPQAEKINVKATTSVEAASLEAPAEPIKETEQPPARRNVFRNFFNFFKFSR